MFRTFKWRLTASFMTLVLAFVLLGGLLGISRFDRFYEDSLHQNLISEGKMAEQLLGDYEFAAPGAEINTTVKQLAQDSQSRITLVALDGNILADSHEDIATMANHSTYPEIKAALKGEIHYIRRVDPVTEKDTMYVAVPVVREGTIQGVLRMAVSPGSMKSLIFQMWWVILLVIIPAGILAMMVSLRFVNRLTTPLSDMTQIARSMAEGNLKRRVLYNREDEIGILAKTMNTMATSLDEKMTEISEVKGRLETVLENTVNGIILISSDDQILFINTTGRKLLGVEDKEVVGKRQIEVTRSFALAQCIDQVIQDRKTIRQELVLHSFGDRMVQTTVVPIEDGSQLQGILIVLNDITELKKLETIRKDFVANVSHELKTPIAAISGFAETLMAENAENQTCHEFSRIIYDEATRLTRLVESLLELSRIESENPNLKLEQFDIKNCITKSIERFDLQLSDKHLTINTQFPGTPVLIRADWDRITQVMINLIDNAINYSEEGNSIDVVVEDRTHDVMVQVTDHGAGIPMQETKRIFERFYRVDKARSRKVGGSGLGLSIVKHIIEVHGGYVDVRSQVGRGSTFIFTLPR